MRATLARSVMASLTTLLAILALAIFGGPAVRGFALAVMWGVPIGTCSSVYVAGADRSRIPVMRQRLICLGPQQRLRAPGAAP